MEIGRPIQGRPTPYALTGDECVTFANATRAQPVGRRMCYRRLCVHGRAAVGARELRAPVPTVAHLEVDPRFATEEAKVFDPRGDGDSVRRAREVLAVGAICRS